MGSSIVFRPLSWRWTLLSQRRTLSLTASLLSGHNRWSKIRHGKASADAVKSRERTWLSYEVFLASKYGGPDPVLNSRLAIAIANAKKGQLAKPQIEAAIAKGQGKSVTGAALENVTVEALLPFGVAAVIEYQTDNKNRIMQDARLVIKNGGGTVTSTAFLFDRKGKIWFETKAGIGVDEAMDIAIEAGAEDITVEDDMLVVETAPSDVTSVAQQLQDALSLTVHKTELLYDPKQETVVPLSEEQEVEIQKIIDSIEEEPNLQALYLNSVSQ